MRQQVRPQLPKLPLELHEDRIIAITAQAVQRRVCAEESMNSGAHFAQAGHRWLGRQQVAASLNNSRAHLEQRIRHLPGNLGGQRFEKHPPVLDERQESDTFRGVAGASEKVEQCDVEILAHELLNEGCVPALPIE